MGFALNGDTGLHVQQPLTDLVVAFQPDLNGFVRTKMFQRKVVPHLSDKIRRIVKDDLLRLYDAKAGSAGQATRVQYRIDSSLTFNATLYMLEAVVDDLDAMNADAALMHAQRQTMIANSALDLALERVAIDKLRDTTQLTNNVTQSGAAQWDNYTSPVSDPIIDLQNWITDVEAKSGGKKVNRVLMSRWVWNKLKNHPNVIDRFKANDTTTGAILTHSWLASLLDVDPSAIIVTSATYSDTTQPNAAVQRSFIGPDVVVAHVEDGGLNDYSLGHEFAFNGFTSDPKVVLTYRDNTRGLGQDIIKVASVVDFSITQPQAGFLAKGVVNKTSAEYGGTAGYLNT